MRKTLLFTLIIGISLLSNGCITTSHEFNYVEQAIKDQIYPAKLKKNFKFSFGPLSLSAVKLFVKLADTDDEAIEYIKEIKDVQVGVYEIRHSNDETHIKIPQNAEQKLTDLGWEIFVKVKERDSQVDIFFTELDLRTISIYAIVLEDDELIIVETRGRLDNLIEKVLQEHKFIEGNII